MSFLLNGFKRIIPFILIAIFGGTIFLTSSRFNNEVNAIKYYFLAISLLTILLAVIICGGDMRKIAVSFSCSFLYGLFCVGSVECIYVVVQYLIATKNTLYPWAVTGTFENSVGVISNLTLLYPLGLLWQERKNGWKRLLVVFQLLLYVVVICICKSRTGLLAIVLSTFVFYFIEKESFRKLIFKPYVIFGLVILISFLCVCALRWKVDSTNGRILIWKVCLNMIKEKPLLGYGWDGFTANYMLGQANYFLCNPDSQYALLADNTSTPFNCFIHVAIIGGCVGLLCLFGILTLLCYRMSRTLAANKAVWFGIMASLLSMSMFTYPFHYAPVWFIILLWILYPIRDLIPSNMRFSMRIIISCVIGCCLLCVNHMILNEMRWKWTQDKSFKEGMTYSMLKCYKQLSPHLHYNKHFLYNYGAELNYCGYYAESIQIMDECVKKLNNYDVQLVQADNYYHMGDTLLAIDSYETASLMIPCRFIPLDGLLDIYKAQNEMEKALVIAKRIIDKPVKIPSDIVQKIKKEAILFYTNNQ